MSKREADFSKVVREEVAKRVAYRCSRPGCFRLTSGPHSDPRKSLQLGQAAHIIAAADGGPRASADITPEQRRSIENAIWLCLHCATLIDKDEHSYPVEELRKWKADAEAAARHENERTLADPLSVLQTPQAFPPHEDIFHPHTLREAFTGRARQRQSLTRWWKEDGPPVRVLVGMGGLGKSSLAWVWMREDVLGTAVVRRVPAEKQGKRGTGLRVSERPEGVLWWSFYAPELQIQKSFELFIDRALGYVSGGQIQPDNIPSLNEKIDVLLDRLRSRRFLIILDGFERATKLYDQLTAPYEAELLEHEPASELRRCSDNRAGRFLRETAATSRSRILVTSRVHPADVDGMANVERHDLEALDPDESLGLFRTLGVKGADADILEACSVAGHHPLAVRLMIGYVMNTAGQHRGHVHALPETPLDLTPEGRQRHIFEVAYNGLGPQDKEFFSRVAVYTQATSYHVLRICSPFGSGDDLDRAIERLEQRSFLSYDREHSTYDMHPLVRQYAYAQMATAERRQAARDAYTYLADRLPKHETTLATLSLTLEVYRQAMQGGLVAVAVEIFRYRLYPILFFRIGECHTQVRMLEELVAAVKQCPERVNLHTLAVLMNHLSTACNLAGLPREGYRWATDAAALMEPTDPSGTFEASRLVYVASSAMRIGKLAFAVDTLEKSVTGQIRGGDRFREGIARLNLAWALTYSARFGEAATHLDSAAEIFGDSPKSTHWRCILSVHRARLQLLSGRGERALRIAREAYDIADKAGNETDLIRAQWALGAALVRRVEEDATLCDTCLPEAEAHLVAALKKSSETHFGDFTMELQIALAHWHFADGDPAQAQQAAESVCALAEEGGHALKQAEANEILSELRRLAATGSIQDGAATESANSRQADQLLAVWSLSSIPHVISLEP